MTTTAPTRVPETVGVETVTERGRGGDASGYTRTYAYGGEVRVTGVVHTRRGDVTTVLTHSCLETVTRLLREPECER